MAIVKTIKKGESLSIGFAFPETYDITRLQNVKVYIGSRLYANTMDGQIVRVVLRSNDTKLLTGTNIINLLVDDSIFGIRKVDYGALQIIPTQAIFADESVNLGYDFLIPLIVTENTISVDNVLYSVLKGDKGDAGTIEVGTVEIGDAGTQVIVENVGTPSEAILNFKIPKGDAGDFFQGTYNTVIDKLNIVWVDGWVHIDTGLTTNLRKVDVGCMAINTGQGTVQLKPIVHYPAALTYLSSSIPTGFYVKDVDNLLNENTDFETLDIRYNTSYDGVTKYDGTAFNYGHNAILDESTGETFHSSSGVKAFHAVYPEFIGDVVQSVLDTLTNFSRVEQWHTPTYCKIKEANIVSRPYSNGSISESVGSNADILTIASHYDNTFARHDITANATTFLKNVIAIGSCQATGIPTDGTSYGYGMEFSEVGNNLGLNAAYPNVTFPHIVAWGTLSPDGLTITNTHPGRSFLNLLQIANGSEIGIGNDTEITQTRIIDTILSATELTVTEAFDPFVGTMYIYVPEALIGTVWQPVADYQSYYQSPVTSIIMAKFRKIQDLSGANWHICRMAARSTASNGGVWDMYRGFGVIDVDAAVQYITDNYKSLEYRAMLADQHDGLNGISPFITYPDLLPNSPISKALAEGQFVAKETGKSLILDTEITKLATIDFNLTKTTPIDADSVGLWDSVAVKFVRTTLANFKAFLKTYFDTLYVKLVTGKSLISDTEITRLAGVTNQTLAGLGGEATANKQNSLAVDGTGVKFPTVDTLNANFRLYEPVIPYANRVLADSGILSDVAQLTKEYVENLSLLPYTEFLWSGDAGMKTRASGVNLFGTKLYDMVSATQDLAQVTEASQPHIGGTIAPSEVRKLKGLTGETGTKGFTGANIAKLATASWSIATMLKWNSPRTSSRIYLSATNYILLTPTTITLVGDAVNILACTNTLAAGINNLIQFEYSNNAGLIRVNGVEIATTVLSGAVTFGSLYLNQTTYNFDGEIHYMQIFNKRLSAIEAQVNYTFWRNRIPKIEGIAIGNQFWTTSNSEVGVDNTGVAIPEIQAAGNVEKITNAADREFSEDTGFWTKTPAWVISSGVARINTAGNPDFNHDLGRDPIISANRMHKLVYTVIENIVTTNFYLIVLPNPVSLPKTIGTHTIYFSSTYRSVSFRCQGVSTGAIDNVSIEEVGWSGMQAAYDGLIAQGKTVAQATAACQAWCYYNNLPENGAVYGKLYNWWAIANLAPAGYRVPTDADFSQLTNYLGGGLVAGGKMKKEGLTYWTTPNTGATNESGFSSLPDGRRNTDGTFDRINTHDHLWSLDANVWYADNGSTQFISVSASSIKASGRSIRFLRNEPVGDTERTIETGYITNALGATNLDIIIPFGYQVESVRIDSETNITGLSAKLLTGALVELETLFTAKSVTANVQKVISADVDQSIQQTNAVVRINGTKADTTKRFRVWVKLTKVVFS